MTKAPARTGSSGLAASQSIDICRIARAIKRSGKTTSQAISIAVSRVKKWAAGGDDVDADTRAKAAAAVAEWEKLKAKNRARSTAKSAAKDVKASNMSALGKFDGLADRGALDRVVAFAGKAPPFVKKDGGDPKTTGKTEGPSGGGLNSPAAIRAAWAKAKTPEEKARIKAAAKKFKIELS